jgi:hypothetical protein
MIGARAITGGSQSRPLLVAVGLAAGVGLVALLTVVGVLGAGGPTEDDVRQAYQEGFDSGLSGQDAADAAAGTADDETSSDVRGGIRVVPEVYAGHLVEVSEACFQRPVVGCPEIY